MVGSVIPRHCLLDPILLPRTVKLLLRLVETPSASIEEAKMAVQVLCALLSQAKGAGHIILSSASAGLIKTSVLKSPCPKLVSISSLIEKAVEGLPRSMRESSTQLLFRTCLDLAHVVGAYTLTSDHIDEYFKVFLALLTRSRWEMVSVRSGDHTLAWWNGVQLTRF